MKWNPKDEDDKRIVKQSPWINIDKYKEIEKRAGVYIFASADYDIKYIGKAGPRRLVLEYFTILEIYSALSRGKDKGATIVKALYTNSNDTASDLELDLVIKYNPENNIYLKSEDIY
jgi:excinuclease UvrABC nuclease subunit